MEYLIIYLLIGVVFGTKALLDNIDLKKNQIYFPIIILMFTVMWPIILIMIISLLFKEQ